MKATIVKTVTLTLDDDEATWLLNQMEKENPEESGVDWDMRTKFWKALGGAGDVFAGRKQS